MSSWIPPTPAMTGSSWDPPPSVKISRDQWATTWGCMTGQSLPTPTITSVPNRAGGSIINPDWSAAVYPVNRVGLDANPYPDSGAILSGTTWMSCQKIQQTSYYGAAIQVTFQPEVSDLCVVAYLGGICVGPSYHFCATSTKTFIAIPAGASPTTFQYRSGTPTTESLTQLGFNNDGNAYVVGAFQVAKTTPNVVTTTIFIDDTIPFVY